MDITKSREAKITWARDLPDCAHLHECLSYNPHTGKLTWKFRPDNHFAFIFSARTWNKRFAGKEINTISKGYVAFGLKGESVLAHRAIWKMTYGTDPLNIDHIDGNKTNNKLSNLREATNAENMKNMRIFRNNKSGCMGVYWHKAHKKWTAAISVDNKLIHLCITDDYFEAICRRKSAEINYGFHPNHGSKALRTAGIRIKGESE
ncbi:TPA: HNH endonuclease [Yersinia enterocolitica]|nr:HNH endonuclease [Yersinia enterocolitica]